MNSITLDQNLNSSQMSSAGFRPCSRYALGSATISLGFYDLVRDATLTGTTMPGFVPHVYKWSELAAVNFQ